jgi:ribonuclease HI
MRSVWPLTLSHLSTFDAILCRAAKEAYGLPNSVSTAAAHEATGKGGLGCPSLFANYNAIQTQRLVTALNDKGPLGQLTRARLAIDKGCLDKITAAAFPALAQHSLRLRQQIAAASTDIEIWKDGRMELSPQEASELLLDAKNVKLIQAPDPPRLLLLDIHHLSQSGIKHIQDLTSATGRSILTPKKIELAVGRTLNNRTRMALRRVGNMLSLPPGISNEAYRAAIPNQTATQAPIHHEYARILKSCHYMAHMDIRKATIGMCWNAQVAATCNEQNMSEIHEYLVQLQARPRVCQSVRNTRDVAPNVAYKIGTAVETGHIIYKRLTAIKQQTPAITKKLHQLYHNYAAEKDLVARIEAKTQASDFKGKGKKRRKTAHQEQYVVHWEPSILQGWTIQIAKSMGYQVQEAIPLKENEMGSDMKPPYECCTPNAHRCKSAHDKHELGMRCQVCHRWYHKKCMQKLAQITTHTDTNAWTCTECTTNNYTAEHLPPDLNLYKVTWQPSNEPKHSIGQNPLLARMLAQLEEQRSQPISKEAHERNQLADAQKQLNSMQKQGDYFPNHPQRYSINLGQEYSNKYKIFTSPINPHTDIHPTGRHEVFIRDVDMRIEGQDWTKTLACIYTPDGKCHHTLTVERAAILYQQYMHAQTMKPRLMKRLKAGTFAEELYSLMGRYKGGAIQNTQTRRKVKPANQWATPPELHQLLHQLTDASKEMFASPLNYNPCMKQYWSTYERDRIFGAKHDAYKYQWTGSSVHCPEFEDEDVNRNIATAVAAARSTDTTVLGLHIVPAWTDSKTAYMRWMQHFPENCKHVVQIPKKHFRFQRPATWQEGEMYAGKPQWDVNIVITGNEMGYRQHFPYWDKDYIENFYKELEATLNKTLPDDKELSDLKNYSRLSSAAEQHPKSDHIDTQLTQMGYPRMQRYLKNRLDTPDRTDCPPIVPVGREADAAVAKLCEALPPAPPLMYDWTEFAYTDGSRKKAGTTWPKDSPGVGAAVFIPSKSPQHEDKKIAILPRGTSCTQENTINRAELVGILTALQQGATQIATDSLTSLQQIQKQLRRPQDQVDHKHHMILQHIAATIISSPERVTLFKVKGHSQTIGNEHADEIAKAVAKGQIAEEECITYEEPSNDRRHKYWPYKVEVEEPQKVSSKAAEPTIPRKRRRALDNLQDALKEQALKRHRYGMSNRSTTYFEAQKRVEDQTDMAASNMFMTSPKVNFTERKVALRYRLGALWTRKMAYRYGHAPNSRCLLCGQEDGGHHTASGCPKLKRMYIDRHNKVGRAIMTRVMRGRLGAYVIQMDLGSVEHCAAEGLQHQPRHLPWDVLPGGLRDAVQRTGSTANARPDGFLYKPAMDGKPAEYWIVEVKICRDSDPDTQLTRAQTQHRHLIQAIQEVDPTARIHYNPLLVGVTGTIYDRTVMYLGALGIRDEALRKCLRTIHLGAIKSLTSIYKTKRKLESKLEPRKCSGKRG